MLTLKFFKVRVSGETNSESELKTFCSSDVVSCHHYEVYERDSGHTSIVIYPNMTKVGGVERHVSDDPSHFDKCYVENIAGKTIAKYESSGASHGEHAGM